ncbi:MAG: hypothetical protein V7696_00285 [Halioglobus sp.]
MYFLILTIYLVCFWDFILGLAQLSGMWVAVLSQVPELTLLIGIFVIQSHGFVRSGTLRRIGGWIDPIFWAFASWLVLTILISENADKFIAFLNAKALIRYVLVFYLATAINWDSKKYLTIRRVFLVCFFIQCFIGLVQWLVGYPALEFFAPKGLQDLFGMRRGSMIDRGRDDLEIFGTFRNTIGFAYLMLIGLVVLLVSQRPSINYKLIFSISLAVCLCYLSGSRIVLLLMLALLALRFLGLENDWIKLRKWFVLGPVLLVIAIYAYLGVLSLDLELQRGSMAYIFSPKILEGLMNQRLGIITLILPQVATDPMLLIGYGADKFSLAANIANTVDVPNQVLVDLLDQTLEDVYWIAILFYYGYVGFFLWILFFFMVYNQLAKVEIGMPTWVVESCRVAKILLLASIPLNFVNQAFENQIFSLALWTFAAITVAAMRQSARTLDGHPNLLLHKKRSSNIPVPAQD